MNLSLNKRPNLFAKWMVICLVVLTHFACGQSNQIKDKEKQVEQFLSYLKDNNQQAIYDMCFHVSSGYNITKDNMRIHYVRAASELIQQYGLPPKSQWIFTSDVNSHLYSYVVEIPLPIKPDTSSAKHLVKASFLIYFPPEQFSNLIFDFNIMEETNFHGKLQAPGGQK